MVIPAPRPCRSWRQKVWRRCKHSVTWTQAFVGSIHGSIGETSTLAILIGGLLLLITRVASWRIVLGVFLGMFALSSLFNLVGSDD